MPIGGAQRLRHRGQVRFVLLFGSFWLLVLVVWFGLVCWFGLVLLGGIGIVGQGLLESTGGARLMGGG